MKKIILSLVAASGVVMAGHAQSIFLADNTTTETYDTTLNGVANLSQDLNLELIFATTAGGVSVGANGAVNGTDIVTLLLSSNNSPSTGDLGQTGAAAGDIAAFSGLIYDNSGNGYSLAAFAGQTGYFEVLAWTGDFSSYAAAMAGGALIGTSQTWSAQIPSTPNGTPLDATPIGMINLTNVPEPTTMALAGLGGLSLFLLRRKK